MSKKKLGKKPEALKGRPKGVPNKITIDIKEMIEAALRGAGGTKYLIKQAHENTAAFLTLVGKILPTKVVGDRIDGKIEIVVRTAIDAPASKMIEAEVIETETIN